ncbi:hypothetical protein GIB67_032125 [Kingdonia uniflora]|uniref:Uncharacterized protein n=1 Tax=Kingdonia uniflora TaxID=39325 RepID=A0A7J7MX33_9MAGN|nr:hypothetical protein GIB67_032125 [Kingdonia uniflora]
MEAALRNNPNVAVRIGGSNNLTRSPPTSSENITQSQPDSPSEEIQSTSKEEENKCKRTMAFFIKSRLWLQIVGKKIQVGFNEKGQAIEEGSVDLSTFLGSLGREMVPITVHDWRGFDIRKLDRVWEIIKEKRKRFKEMRKKQVLPYTSSRKGYARLENDMFLAAAYMVTRVPRPSSLSASWDSPPTRKNKKIRFALNE